MSRPAPSDRPRVLLVDPSLFTAPYDAALTQGLIAAGVEPMWATRPVRGNDRPELPPERTDAFFYRHVDQAEWIPARLRPVAKGLAHGWGLLKLMGRVLRTRPDVVHFQWVVVPLLDVMAIAVIRRWCPVVLTVHDTIAFNGQRMSRLQRLGHDGPTRLAHRVIVHTRGGRQALIERGIAPEKIAVIPHGPLSLSVSPPAAAAEAPRDPRWTCVLFGEIKPYKGWDVLVEAVAQLHVEVRQNLRIVVAGRPRMELAPLLARITNLGLDDQFELRLQRQSEEEMAALFAEADCFLFPYRQIDASGVYFLVKALGKWLIASSIGIFAEEIVDGGQGELLPPEDVNALALALHRGVQLRPVPDAPAAGQAWADIGQSTRALYDSLSRAGEAEAPVNPRQQAG